MRRRNLTRLSSLLHRPRRRRLSERIINSDADRIAYQVEDLYKADSLDGYRDPLYWHQAYTEKYGYTTTR